MTVVLAQICLVVGLLLIARYVIRPALELWAWKKAGEEYERQQALRREWKVGIPYDPNKERE